MSDTPIADELKIQTWQYLCDRAVSLEAALRDLLPMAEDYLKSAPSHPDNAKLETARALLTKVDK